MSRPKLLDLFCGAGGAGMGYSRAGFEVVGVDIAPQLDYPFNCVIGDALDFLAANWRAFDVIHASPPCQASTALTKGTNKGRQYVQLIPETRRLMRATGLPSILENVQGSDLRRDLTLCGEMFGLDVIRHRYFEIEGAYIMQPEHPKHRGRVRGWRHGTYYDGPYVAVYGEGGGKGTVAEWQAAMGIDWTEDRKAIAEAIPPSFTEHIGSRLIEQIGMGRRMSTCSNHWPCCPCPHAGHAPNSPRHVITDPLCALHVPPRTDSERDRFDRQRGIACPTCTNDEEWEA